MRTGIGRWRTSTNGRGCTGEHCDAKLHHRLHHGKQQRNMNMRGNKPPPGDWPTLPKHYSYRHTRWYKTLLQTVAITMALGGGAVLSIEAGYQSGVEEGK